MDPKLKRILSFIPSPVEYDPEDYRKNYPSTNEIRIYYYREPLGAGEVVASIRYISDSGQVISFNRLFSPLDIKRPDFIRRMLTNDLIDLQPRLPAIDRHPCYTE